MKCVFLTFNYIPNSGIGIKIKSQVSALKTLVDCDFIYTNSIGIYVNDIRISGSKISYYNRNFHYLCLGRLNQMLKGYDVIFLRYSHFFNALNSRPWASLLERNNIVIEIPTFPYDGEYKTFNLSYIRYLSERNVRYGLLAKSKLIINYASYTTLFGVKAVNIRNGVGDHLYPEEFKFNAGKRLTFIGIASMEFWHGYDLFIRALGNMKNTAIIKNIRLVLVGLSDNITSRSYLELIVNHGLEDIVETHPYKSGAELEDLIKRSDVGLGCLAITRKMTGEVKSLKNAEYIFRGLPVVYSENDIDLLHLEGTFKLDSALIDLESMLEWYYNIDYKKATLEYRELQSKLTWKYQFEKVFDTINNN